MNADAAQLYEHLAHKCRALDARNLEHIATSSQLVALDTVLLDRALIDQRLYRDDPAITRLRLSLAHACALEASVEADAHSRRADYVRLQLRIAGDIHHRLRELALIAHQECVHVDSRHH